MIMEYCGGGDLSSYYTKPKFSSREYARVVRELVSGVSYLHGRGFAHRDLKPENCLLEEGLRPRLKLADFGLAKVQKPSVCATRGIGTPNYMPPEMFQFDDDVEEEDMDVRALDIFAIGVIMWQLWFKAVPFEGKSTHKIMNLLLKGKRMPLEATATAAAPDPTLSVLIEKCWSQEPSLRPTIDQVFESFDKIVGTS
jgi:serine/threonine protein kinase